MTETFMGAGAPTGSSEAVVLGAAMASVYPDRHPHATAGPAAIRAASWQLSRFAGNYDFDLEGPFASWLRRLADGGDINTVRADAEGNRRRITSAVSAIVDRGAMPLVLGGDDSVAEPFVAGWRDHGPITVVQIDAHLDFRDEVGGEPHGYSSPMRRASEMGWVRRIVHVGQRGVGSARMTDVQDSIEAGNVIVRARELAHDGPAAVAGRLLENERFVIVYDVDGTDPADIPAVRAPVPGGPGAVVVSELIAALTDRGTLEGLVVTEFEPELDPTGTSAMAIVRILCRALEGRLGRQPA
ncbi:MAG: arginase family protein [Candidatus Limnocylindrales bacterium]